MVQYRPMPGLLTLPKFIAHRGTPKYVAENTVASMRKAKELGATWIECDVMLTKDYLPIIMHDNSVNRTTNGKGVVAKMMYEQIKMLDAGGGERVPVLEDWLRTAAELGLGINLEIKEHKKRAHVIAKKIHEALRNWPSHLPAPFITSATHACLRAYHELDDSALLGLIMDRWSLRWARKLKSTSACALIIHYKELNKARVEKLHEAGYQVLAYTVNEANTAQQLFAVGVDSVFTDDVPIQHELNVK